MITGPDTGGLISIPDGYSTSGDMTGWIIFLQNGSQCGANGENCLILEGALVSDGYSSVDMSLIPPHAFNSAMAFSYTDGSGGRSCDIAECECDYDVFCSSTDYESQIISFNTTAVRISIL